MLGEDSMSKSKTSPKVKTPEWPPKEVYCLLWQRFGYQNGCVYLTKEAARKVKRYWKKDVLAKYKLMEEIKE